METTTLYYFEVLPIHPQPEGLESFTSYLARLAEANHIRTRQRLFSICFPDRHTSHAWTWMDHLPLSWGLLPIAAACPVPVLQATTFMHLARKFARSPLPGIFSQFLKGCVAEHLRYCPHCLEEHPYYSLAWRFLALTGCVQHNCQLLDRCGHCGQVIPFLPPPFKPGACPSCGEELRACLSEPLTEAESQRARNRFDDLAFMLSPQDCESAEHAGVDLGRRFAYWRRIRGWRQMDAAGQMANASVHIVSAIEQKRHYVQLTFDDYLAYAECLGLTLRDVFNTPLPPAPIPQADQAEHTFGRRLARYVREREVVRQVQQAIQTLQEQGKPVSQTAIGKAVGQSATSLMHYPQVKAILNRTTHTLPDRAKRSQQREDELMDKTSEAIERLRELGKPVSSLAVSHILGRSKIPLMYYPRVRMLIEQARLEDVQKRENELVDKTLSAVGQLLSQHRPIVLTTIAPMIGLSRTHMRNRPHLMAIVRQAAEQYRGNEVKRRQAERESREEKLVEEVHQAMHLLEARGEPITGTAIGKMLGKSLTGLDAYPRVKAILKQIIAKRRRSDRTSDLTAC